jgi:hypothetical protein
MVTITKVDTGKCIWCLENAEGVQAQFKDGLSGFFCKKHFWQAMQVRGERPVEENPPVRKP